ncbi:MAG: hypothetical protein PHG25_02370 [Candidatus Pacebacteria bacterium]|nr:hypothetical protein [Candidatus Paceibacterota bacterium]
MNVASAIGREFDDTTAEKALSSGRWIVGLFFVIYGILYVACVLICLAIINIFSFFLWMLGAITFFVLRYKPEGRDVEK